MKIAHGHRGLLGFAFVAVVVAVALVWWRGEESRPHREQPSIEPSGKLPALRWGVGSSPEPLGGATLAGQVVNGEGAPLQVAEVCAQRKQLDMLAAPRHCAQTDASGRYRLTELPGGPYSVVASAADHASQRAETDPLVLGGDEQRSDVDFTLLAARANVRGVVRDALGGTVAGARVRLATAIPPYQGGEAETDEEGRFVLHFPEGPVVATATAEGYAPAELSTVVPAARMELTLTPGGRIAGVVQRPDGTPVVDADVRPEHGGVLNARSRIWARSDASGHFELRALPPGAYRLVAKAPHAEGTAHETISLGMAESVDGLVIEVEPASRVVGRVQVQGTGEACPQGSVMLSGMPDPMQAFPEAFVRNGARAEPVPTQVASIGVDGTVEFSGVPAGTYYPVVRCDGHRFVEGPERVTLPAKAGDVGPLDWFVTPAATLTVRTVDEGGEPVGRQPLRLRMPPPAPGMGRGMLQMITDAQGVVRVPDLRTGPYAIGPVDPQRGDNLEVEVAEGQLDVEVTLPLRGSASITVTALDEQERPVEGLQVTATPVPQATEAPGPRPQYGSPTGAGRYALGPLAPGTYRIEASDGINPVFGGVGPDSHVRLLSGERAEVTLHVERGGRIRGRVTDVDGQPAADVWVSARAEQDTDGPLSRASSSAGRVLTDGRGEFTLEGLSEVGVYTISAQEPYGSELSQAGVAAGESVELQLPPTGRLEGQLRAEDGSPARVHLARATSADGRVERVGRVSRDGMHFAIDSMPVGEVRVLAASVDGQVVSAHVHVQPGDEPTYVELALAEPAQEGAQPGPRPGLAKETPARAD